MTNFEKDTIELELLSDDFEMVETDDTKVLDTTQMTPKEKAADAATRRLTGSRNVKQPPAQS